MSDSPATVVVRVPGGGLFLDPDPEETERRRVRLVDVPDDSTIGIVGCSTAGLEALGMAADNPQIPRLVLASVPYVEDSDSLDLTMVAAKTLLLFGARDPQTGSRTGRQWQRALPDARLEMVPDGGHDLIVPMWSRVLAHVAPRRTR